MNGPVTVPLPTRFGLGPIKVTAIKTHTVTMEAPLIDSSFDVKGGGCSSTVIAGETGTVDMTCHAGSKALVNGMNLTVVGIVHKDAVIRIRPAS